MIDTQKIAREAGLYVCKLPNGVTVLGGSVSGSGSLLIQPTLEELERFAALYREAVVQELTKEVWAADAWLHMEDDGSKCYITLFPDEDMKYKYWQPLYTKGQLAGAVLRKEQQLLETLKYVRAVLPNDRWADDTKRMIDATIALAEGKV